MKNTAALIGGLALGLALALAGCIVTPEGIQQKEVVLADVFPPSKTVASYCQTAKPRRAGADELLLQLGGKTRLEQMRKWSAFSSQVCEYGLPNHPPKVCVSVSEMSTRVDAYGAYTNVRPAMLPESQYIKVGVHGTLDGERLIFVHDKFLIIVRDLEQTPDEQRRTLLVNFARAISGRIPRPVSDVEPLAFMPFPGRVPGSERLDKDDPLGLGIFEGGAVSAVYRIEKREARIFLAQVVGAWLKRNELARLRKAMEQSGKVSEIKIGDAGCQGRLNKHDAMVAQRENVVFGVLGSFTEDEMREMMADMDRRIRPFAPVTYGDMKKAEKKKEQKAGGFRLTQ